MEKPRKTFEFRMSKKVAELTQVVHMLFTRNHEKEVEMAALKDAYEYEIELVIKDAKSKISILETQVMELVNQNDPKKVEEKQKIYANSVRDEYEQKLRDTEILLQEEKLECQNLRDLLISTQSDIEQLRQGVSEQLTYKKDEISRKDQEIDKLKKHSSLLEQKLKNIEKEMNIAIREAERNAHKLQDELTHMHSALNESQKNRDMLISRIKQLETELKSCQKDFSRKVSEMVSSQVDRLSKSAHHSESEELDRLRKEIQKYRLELSNRDLNFNRMFTEKQPIFVESSKSNSKSNPSSSSLTHVSLSNGFISHPPSSAASAYHKDRSYSQIFSLPAEDKKPPKTRPNSAAVLGQLPTISTVFNDRSRLTKLLKPKPLPREMLFSKT